MIGGPARDHRKSGLNYRYPERESGFGGVRVVATNEDLAHKVASGTVVGGGIKGHGEHRRLTGRDPVTLHLHDGAAARGAQLSDLQGAGTVIADLEGLGNRDVVGDGPKVRLGGHQHDLTRSPSSISRGERQK